MVSFEVNPSPPPFSPRLSFSLSQRMVWEENIFQDGRLIADEWGYGSGNNQYGYQYHFDIMAQSEVLGDNVIVDFEETTCPGAASSDFAQCECGKGS